MNKPHFTLLSAAHTSYMSGRAPELFHACSGAAASLGRGLGSWSLLGLGLTGLKLTWIPQGEEVQKLPP